jgi:hypothetical protein
MFVRCSCARWRKAAQPEPCSDPGICRRPWVKRSSSESLRDESKIKEAK